MTTQLLSAKLIRSFPPLSHALSGCNEREIVDALLGVEDRLRCYQKRWLSHPQCQHWQSLPQMKWYDHNDPANAQVIIAYKHKPGVDKREHSFVVCSVGDLTFAYNWSTRTRIGDFAGIYALPHWMNADPHQLTLYSYTHEGRARGFHCREELKRLLPTRLHKWVSKTRSAKKTRKLTYLATVLWELWKLPLPVPDMGTLMEMERSKQLPEAYYKLSKAQMWVLKMKQLNAEDARDINYFIRLEDFYMGATGQVEPLTVESLFIRTPNRLSSKMHIQLPLF